MSNPSNVEMIRFILAIIFLSLLTACNFGVLVTNQQLVEKAIALQVNLSQQINPQLWNSHTPSHFKIDQVAISEVQPLTIQDLPSFRVRGTYSLTVKLPKRQVTQKKNPFELYLQQQKEGKTWRLLRPQMTDSTINWLTYLIQ